MPSSAVVSSSPRPTRSTPTSSSRTPASPPSPRPARRTGARTAPSTPPGSTSSRAASTPTHMELPFGGTFASDTFETGTRAAAWGSTTTIVDFAVQSVGHTLREGLDTWHAKAEGNCAIDYAFHMIVSDVNQETLKEMDLLIEGVTASSHDLRHQRHPRRQLLTRPRPRAPTPPLVSPPRAWGGGWCPHGHSRSAYPDWPAHDRHHSHGQTDTRPSHPPRRARGTRPRHTAAQRPLRQPGPAPGLPWTGARGRRTTSAPCGSAWPTTPPAGPSPPG
ncbi:D-phenylhydantoinase [Streptomyces canarius]